MSNPKTKREKEGGREKKKWWGRWGKEVKESLLSPRATLLFYGVCQNWNDPSIAVGKQELFQLYKKKV